MTCKWNAEWPTPTEWAMDRAKDYLLWELDMDPYILIGLILELDPSVASSRDKGELIEAVQRLVREAGE